MIDEAIEEITKMLIEQDIKEKNSNSVEIIKMKKIDLYKHCIKLLKVVKKCL